MKWIYCFNFQINLICLYLLLDIIILNMQGLPRINMISLDFRESNEAPDLSSLNNVRYLLYFKFKLLV